MNQTDTPNLPRVENQDTPIVNGALEAFCMQKALSDKSPFRTLADTLRRLELALAKAKDEAENQRQAAIMNAEQRDFAMQVIAKANADKAVLVDTLEKAADCLADGARVFSIFGKSIAAEAMLIAEQHSRAALSQVQAHEDEPVCPYCNKSCATILDVALHVQATHSREA